MPGPSLTFDRLDSPSFGAIIATPPVRFSCGCTRELLAA